jgi:hypothetical protein
LVAIGDEPFAKERAALGRQILTGGAEHRTVLEFAMLTLTLTSLLLAASPIRTAAAQATVIVEETFDEQAGFPNAAVFFLPRSSVISPLAADVIDRAARHVSSGAIVLLQASSDHEAGETSQTAVERADAVRLELVRSGVPASAIRIMYAGVSRSGIESRRVVISVISPTPSSPRVATVETVPAVAR